MTRLTLCALLTLGLVGGCTASHPAAEPTPVAMAVDAGPPPPSREDADAPVGDDAGAPDGGEPLSDAGPGEPDAGDGIEPYGPCAHCAKCFPDDCSGCLRRRAAAEVNGCLEDFSAWDLCWLDHCEAGACEALRTCW